MRPLLAVPLFVLALLPVARLAEAQEADSSPRWEFMPPYPGDGNDVVSIQIPPLEHFEMELDRAIWRRIRASRHAPDESSVEVWLALDINARGRLAGVAVERSSGQPPLDDLARKAAARAKARLPVPAPLRGQAFVARVKVRFVKAGEK